MEKFGGAPKIRWEGQADIAGEAIGEEALHNANAMAGDLELAPQDFKVREVNHEADPFAASASEQARADEILNENTVLQNAKFDRGEAASNDPRFDHVGSHATTTNTSPVVAPPRKAFVPPTAKKSFFGNLKKLFGGE